MTKEEILHLGTLSRLALTPEEAEAFKTEIDAVLAYVSAVTAIAGTAETKTVGARYNIMREDVVTNTPGQYTEVLLKAAPAREGHYVAVKKIIDQSQ